MKILAIRGENIASLGLFHIPFDEEPIRSAGLFAITGRTGSGKSSLLDALCLALYHTVPRLHGATVKGEMVESALGLASLGDVKHLIRRGTSHGYAETDFIANNGKKYRSHWGYRKPRRKGSKSQEEIFLQDLDTNEIISHRKNECALQITTLLGLSFDQFTRTVLLAQGQFAVFLKTTDAKERTAILEQITGTQLYTRIGATIAERYKQETESLKLLRSQHQNILLLSEEERHRLIQQKETIQQRIQQIAPTLPLLHSFSDIFKQYVKTYQSLNHFSLQEKNLAPFIDHRKKELKNLRQAESDLTIQYQNLQEEIDQAIQTDTAIEQKENILHQRKKTLRQQQENLDQINASISSSEKRQNDLQQRIQNHQQKIANSIDLQPLAQNWKWFADSLSSYAEYYQIQQESLRQKELIQTKLSSLTQAIERQQDLLQKKQKQVINPNTIELFKRNEQLGIRKEQLLLSEDLKRKEQEKQEAIVRQAELDLILNKAQKQQEKAYDAYHYGKLLVQNTVESLRSHLQPQQPCPVCGSLEHPFSQETAEAFKAQLDKLGQEWQSAKKQQASAEEKATQNRIIAQHIEVEIPKIQEKLKNIILSDTKISQYQQISKIEQEIKASLRQLDLIKQVEDLQKDLLDIQRQKDVLMQKSILNQEKIEDAFAKLTHLTQAVSPDWDPDKWRSLLIKNPQAFLEKQEKLVREFQELQRQEEKDCQELEQEKEHKKHLIIRRTDIERLISLQQKELDTAQAEQKQFKDKRTQLLQGHPTVFFRKQWEEKIQISRQQVSSAEQDLQKSQLEMERLSTQISSIKQNQEKELSQLHQISASLQNFSQPFQEHFTNWALEQFSLQSDEISTWVKKQYQHLSQQQREEQNLHGSLEEKLASDDRSSKQKSSLQQEIEQQLKKHEVWENLYQLLGVNQGAHFRAIAQQYSLEVLLEIANQKIRQMTPRYSLKKQEDSMHFVVVDSENYNAQRPVHTLSGGESFIISLGLALALSHLAGGNQAIETLFIDEGFGSLDSDTLRHVMNALDSLHSQGRKVGLITHVEEMKERIPVRIEVQKIAPGLSQVITIS